MKRFVFLLLLSMLFIPALSPGGDLYEDQLNRGIRNSEPYSYLLIKESKTNKAEARNILQEALRYSPDLPAVYFELAKNSFKFTPDGIFETVDYMRKGIAAYKRNFWWSYMMIASLFMGMILSFVSAVLILILIRLPQDIPLLSHDIKEDKINLLILPVLSISIFGPLYLLAGLLIIISLIRKMEQVRCRSRYLFLLISPWVFNTLSAIFHAPASGELRAVAQVNESKGNRYALSLLKTVMTLSNCSRMPLHLNVKAVRRGHKYLQ
jgi:hypothetical protein